MTCMTARTSSNFGLIGPPTAELAALEHRRIMGRMMSPFFSAVLDRLQVMITYMRAWMSLKFGQIQPLVLFPTTGFVMCLY